MNKIQKHLHNFENFLIGLMFTLKWIFGFIKPTKQLYSYRKDRKLIFHDEFNNPILDKNKWRNGEDFLKLNRNVSSLAKTDSNMIINKSIAKFIVKEEKGTYQNWDGPFDYNYTHSVISTDGKFEHTYGRWESCIKVSNNKRLWPAFWLLSVPWVDDRRKQENKYSILPEIDIIEHFGGENRKYKNMQFTYHYGQSYEKGEHFQLPTSIKRLNFSKDFFIYSIEWTEKYIKWYINDELVKVLRFKRFKHKNDIANKPAFIIVNDIVNSEYGDIYKSEYQLPDGMEVDWVRVYDKK